eukprot:scaffold4944_cov135-Isochrysis_galbana.AAC.9
MAIDIFARQHIIVTRQIGDRLQPRLGHLQCIGELCTRGDGAQSQPLGTGIRGVDAAAIARWRTTSWRRGGAPLVWHPEACKSARLATGRI